MRKDSFIIFGTSVLITAVIAGAAHYMAAVGPPPDTVISEKGAVSRPAAPAAVNVGPDIVQPTWTDDPIKCFDEQVGEFWTNARTCEGADFSNRISIAAPFEPAADPGTESEAPAMAATKQTKQQQRLKPNIRKVAREVPDGLPVKCKWPIGRALEVERDLSAAKDPAKSIWLDDYCGFIKDSRAAGCRMQSGFFYYEDLCSYGL